MAVASPARRKHEAVYPSVQGLGKTRSHRAYVFRAPTVTYPLAPQHPLCSYSWMAEASGRLGRGPPVRSDAFVSGRRRRRMRPHSRVQESQTHAIHNSNSGGYLWDVSYAWRL